jgi:ribonuclease Z
MRKHLWPGILPAFTMAFLLAGDGASERILAAQSLGARSDGSVQATAGESLKITLIGTGGGPIVNPRRFGISTLVAADIQRLLFDCGRGATLRLAEAGEALGDISKLFLTHLHSDHIVGLPDLLLTPWGAGQRRVPFEVWGPNGTREMMDYLQKAFDFDIRVRSVTNQNKDGIRVVSHDINEGIVFDSNGIRVTAFLVDHGTVKPAFGYRVDYGGHSVALSGDTRFSENLIQFSRGVDVLIHEAADEEAVQRFTPEQRERTNALHTTAEQAGEVFARVKPRLAVYSHAGESQNIIARTRTTYSGPLESGDDLMTIEISDKIDVHHFKR